MRAEHLGARRDRPGEGDPIRNQQPFRVERPNRGRSFALVGELDMATRPALREAIEPELGGEGDLVLDLTSLEFVDSSGLYELVYASNALSGRGKLVLLSPRSNVKRLLEISGIEGLDNVEIR